MISIKIYGRHSAFCRYLINLVNSLIYNKVYKSINKKEFLFLEQSHMKGGPRGVTD